MTIKRPSVFVSYAHKDRIQCEAFLEHLGWLQNSGLIRVFDDSQIKPGEQWEARILDELDKSDLVVLLISPAFVGSRYCTVTEMAGAVGNEKKIIPVLVRPVDFDALPVSRLNAVPLDAGRKLQPISAWRGPHGRDEAWSQVAKAVRLALTSGAIDTLAERQSKQEPREQSGKPGGTPAIVGSLIAASEEVNGVPLRLDYPKELRGFPSVLLEIERSLVPIKETVLSMEFRPGVAEHCEISAAFTTTLCTNRAISIRGEIHHYLGGAHSNQEFAPVNFDLLARKALLLSDLLLLEGHEQEIEDLLIEGILKQKRDRGFDEETADLHSELNEIPFCLKSEISDEKRLAGVSFLFAPYHIGSFAEGTYEVDLEVQALRPFGTSLFLELCGLQPTEIAGRYVRPGEFERAELTITHSDKADHYRVEGFALYGVGRKYGPNLGELDFIGHFDGRHINFEEFVDGIVHRVMIAVQGSTIAVAEEGGQHGHNVTFSGVYHQIRD